MWAKKTQKRLFDLIVLLGSKTSFNGSKADKAESKKDWIVIQKLKWIVTKDLNDTAINKLGPYKIVPLEKSSFVEFSSSECKVCEKPKKIDARRTN